MTISCYSQNNYPKKIVLSNDTVVAITQSQIRVINQKLMNLKVCNEVVNDAETTIDKLNSEITKANSLIDNQKKLTLLQQSQIADYKTLSLDNDKNIKLLNGEIKRQKLKVFKSTALGVLITAVITTTILTLTK